MFITTCSYLCVYKHRYDTIKYTLERYPGTGKESLSWDRRLAMVGIAQAEDPRRQIARFVLLSKRRPTE